MKNTKHYSERLPLHVPDKSLWPKIAEDLGGAEDVIGSSGFAGKLPLQKPDVTLWDKIESSLPLPWYSSGVFKWAGLLVLVFLIGTTFYFVDFSRDKIISGTVATIQNNNPEPQISATEKSSRSEDVISRLNSADNKTKVKTEPAGNNNYSNAAQNSEVPIASNAAAPRKSVDEKAGISTGNEGNNQILLSGNYTPDKMPGEIQPLRPTFFTPDNTSTKITLAKTGSRQNDLKTEDGFSASHDLLVTEFGLFIQPFFTKNLSSINNFWTAGKAAGASLTLRKSNILFETGLTYSQIEFEDNFDLQYYRFESLGSITSFENYDDIAFVDEMGDTVVERRYYPEFVEIFDSTYQEAEKPDMVKLTKIGLPLTIGYTIYRHGRLFADLKTGLELSVITRKLIPGNLLDDENTRLLAIKNDQPDTYSVQWKYNFSLGIGFRINNNWSVYGEPYVSKYLEPTQNRENREMRNPVEAGVKLGIRWGF